ncbi:hypothetical protein B0A52_07435 [Exophiala mesophila]|uniref:DUF1996 domain-containing protein n=1 Tax=Exophiala mesophila TaxID=212818 RepID=A0A438MXH5_EXOME|nr:hypothetical protein B0A52_07435 [Exophiala mesophila]
MASLNVRLKLHHYHPFNMVLVLVLLHLSPCHAFWRHLCFGELGTARVDPIRSPGSPSQHAHVLFGASNIGLDPSIEDLLQSNCTSCSILQDKSNYWVPRLYFEHANGTYQQVATSGGMTVYYFTEGQNTTAFPINFRMITGDSTKRTFYGSQPPHPMAEWDEFDKTQPAIMEKAIGFNCLHYGKSANEGALEHQGLRDKAFIDENCPDGIRAELMFPSCWDGVNLDSDSHSSHVAYPDAMKYGTCPDGYPVRLPTLFYETIYAVADFKGSEGQFVFANGDPTGYGYHGDFICGWDDGILQAAIDSPDCTKTLENAGNGLQEDCPIFHLQNSYNATQCKMETPEILENEGVNLVNRLPGNVEVQAGPEPATIPPSDVPALASSVVTAASESLVSSSGHATTTGPSSATNEPISPGANFHTTTSVYTKDGVEIHMILVQEVLTVTASEPVPAASYHKRHHRHNGHQGRHGQF